MDLLITTIRLFFFLFCCVHEIKMYSNLYTFLQLCSCVCSDYTHWQIIITSMCFGAFDRLYFRGDSANWPNFLLHIIRSVAVLCHIILITRKCRTLWGEPEKPDTGYYVTDEWCNPSSQLSSYMHTIYHSQGALKVFLLCFKGQMSTCHGTQQDLSLSTLTWV